MATYLADRIKKPKYGTHRANMAIQRPRFIIGFDSEADTTSDGRPMLFQFSMPEQQEENTILRIVPEAPNAGLRVFLQFVNETCNDPHIEYLIYVWNLAYELTQIFHDIPDRVKKQSDFNINHIHIDGKLYPWQVSVLNYKRQIVEFRNNRISVKLLDGTGFYKISLDSAAKMLGLGEKYELSKLERSLFSRNDLEDVEFLRYARRDAYITRLIGEYIQEQHRTYSIPTTISAPHFASTVFKTQFLKGRIGVPSANLEQAGLYSYHGGKNGFYLEGPTEYSSIYQYDITSAYPEAMRQLPDIETGAWTKTRSYQNGKHALYLVTLQYYSCIYHGMQNHDGSRSITGLITDTWITGYELDALVRHGECRILSCHGFLFNGDAGGALSEYVDRFFHVKRYSTGPERETAKLLLNSLYGKFFQKQPIGTVGTYDFDKQGWIATDPTLDYDYEAGGLYNPPIASLITGYVRAKIHDLEHKYESIMTSTDGLFGTVAPDPTDLGKELGQLSVDNGRLRIWRERLYRFDVEGKSPKFALHGFHAGLSDLTEIPLARGEYLYEGRQMITLKMSTRRMNGITYSPGQFVRLPYVLRI
jgi:hypothetical protein